MASGGNNRRPGNMQGLLKFCVEATQSEDSTAPSQYTEMTPERQAFLNEALASFQASDPVKQMLAHCQIILAPSTALEEKEESLEELEEYCADIDLAMDFHKMGGYDFLLSLLQSCEAGIRWRSAELIATLVQNNPYCQEKALEQNLLTELLKRLDTDDDMQVRVKALYAVSSLCREAPASQEVFVASDGFSYLLRAMQAGNEKLQLKAAFMLKALCMEQPKYKDDLVSMGMIEQISALLAQPHTPAHEHLMSCLHVLITDHMAAQQEARRSELGLAALLKQRLVEIQGKEEFLEESESCKAVQNILFSGRNAGTVDR